MWAGVKLNSSAEQDWTQVSVALRWTQFTASCLSVFGSSSIIVCVTSQRLRTESVPVLWLCASLLLVSLLWLVASVVFDGCSWLRPLEQIFFFSCFFFSLNFVWTQFVSIRAQFTCRLSGAQGQVSSRVDSRRKKEVLLCGLVPVLLTTPLFIQSEHSTCQTNTTAPDRCLLLDAGALFVTSQHQQPIRACRLLQAYCSSALLCSFLLTLAGITGLLVRSRALLRRLVSCGGFVSVQQRALLRDMDRRTVLYPLVFFCCWSPAVLVASLRLLSPSGPQGPTGAALYITQVLCCGSQGWWVSLVFGGSRSRVFLRDVQTQTPLTRNQKHRDYHSLLTRPGPDPDQTRTRPGPDPDQTWFSSDCKM